LPIELEKESGALLEGVSDVHLYAGPDVYTRQFDIVELARQCLGAGYRGILFKTHLWLNGGTAQLASKLVPGIQVCGSIVLNWTVGGLNPEAVDAAIMIGAKEVYMPNIHSSTAGKGKVLTKEELSRHAYRHLLPDQFHGRLLREVPRIDLLDEDGRLVPQVHEILRLVAEADIILGTCHASKKECFVLVDAARKAGVKKILITHPKPHPNPDHLGHPGGAIGEWWSIDDLKKITQMGAILEFNTPPRDVAQYFAEAIKQVGATHCVLASGEGAIYGLHPIEAMRYFMRRMARHGVTVEELDIMTKKNPGWLLGLD
jgi:hypothetical protein